MNEEREKKSETEEVRQILEMVTERVPPLLREIRNVLYSKETAENMAEAVATFYKKLVEAGIPPEEALKMAKGYMIDLRSLFGKGEGIKLRFGEGEKREGIRLELRTSEEEDEE